MANQKKETRRTFPISPILAGKHARRKSWAEGVTVFLGEEGGRGGTRHALMMTGSRSGELPYTKQLTDDSDLLATDWEVVNS